MAVKTKRNSIYIIYEGYREGYFLEYLEKYSNVRLNQVPCNGGNSNSIVINGIKHSERDIKVYVLFDEDFESKPEHKILDDTLEGLAKKWKLDKDALKRCPYNQLQTENHNMRNPILIISNPQSLEGLLLRLLGYQKERLEGKSTKQLKQMLEGILGNVKLNNEDIQNIESYDKKIALYKEEIDRQKQKQDTPNFKEHCCFLKSRIRDYERRKNKVVFIRFLFDKLPLPVIITKRNEVPEVDTLLNAFGL